MIKEPQHTNTKLTPKLRFKEFDGEWEKRKLGSLGDFKGGGTPSTENVSYWVGDIPWISSSDIDENDVINLNISRFLTEEAISESATKVIPKNSVLFVSRVGVGKLAVTKENICTSQDFANLIPDKTDSYFIAYNFLARNKLLHRYSQGTSIKGFTTGDLKSIPINLPKLPEQQKIANFLTAVDTKLQQLTTKKALLEQYKKGVMQQLFSQQLRFKQEDGSNYPDWEEKKLKEFISDFIVPMRDKPKDLTGEIPWCRIEDFDGKYLEESKSNQGVSLKTVKEMNLKVYPVNTLLVSCSANLGFCAIVKKELITNQTFIGLVPNPKKIEIDYLFHIMKFSSRRLNVLSSGTTISYLSRKQFENFRIKYPNLKEQQKISNYLSGIDNKIEHVSNQIANTQHFKKGLLQQMFV